MAYRARTVDRELREALAGAGAVLIEGPKACGKTETARQVARSQVLLDVDEEAVRAAAVDPRLILEGPSPRLLDEWQVVPGIWNHVRRAVDERGGSGHFILTGSSVPADEQTRHVGAGRVVRVRMRPMSLAESGHSSGEVSLAAALAGERVRASESAITVARLAELVCTGGWPANLGKTPQQAARLLRSYVADVARIDVSRVDGVRRDPQTVTKILRSLARNVATPAAIRVIGSDVNGQEGNVKPDTIAACLDSLARLMITENLDAWAPSLRSKARLRSAPVRHFVDPSLATAILQVSPGRLLEDLEWFGFLFENLVIRDLRVAAQAMEAQLFAYRDESGLEVDAVLELADGRWAAFEIKLGQSGIDAAARQLHKLEKKVDADGHGEPLLLAVITGSGYGYVREDGVAVIPVGALAP